MSKEAQENLLQKQIDDLQDIILKQSGDKSFTRLVKQLEAAKNRLETRLKLLSAEEKKDNTLTFEELGIDRLFVDEAHYFKNLFYVTKMTRVAGLPQTSSQRAFDMFLKVRHLQELNGGGGVIFATGTPVTNTMAEMFTMQRYLQGVELEKQGLATFRLVGGHVRGAGDCDGAVTGWGRLSFEHPVCPVCECPGTDAAVPADGRHSDRRDASIAHSQALSGQGHDRQCPGHTRAESVCGLAGQASRKIKKRRGRSVRGQHAQDYRRGPKGRARFASGRIGPGSSREQIVSCCRGDFQDLGRDPGPENQPNSSFAIFPHRSRGQSKNFRPTTT